MVMAGEILGELVTSVIARGDDAVHNARGFQDGEVAIRRARGECRRVASDLGDRQWPIGAGEHIDEGRAGGRDSLAVGTKAARHGVSEFVIGAGGLHRMSGGDVARRRNEK